MLSIGFKRVKEANSVEEWADWGIVNIHYENFDQITKALRMDTVEIVVLHAEKSPGSYRSVDSGWIEKPLIHDTGYAIVTDARIPRKWFRQEPSKEMNEETRKILIETFPKSFRKQKKPDNNPEKEVELKLSHGDNPWPKLTIPGYSLYPEESNQ